MASDVAPTRRTLAASSFDQQEASGLGRTFLANQRKPVMNPLRFVAFLMVTASFPVLVCRESQAQTTGQSLPVSGVQLASGVHSDSQPPTAESLAVKLDELRAQHRLPAIWIGHFTSQPTSPSPTKLLMVSGVRNATNGQSALPQDIVHLGSCTKSMTAVLIGQGA